MNLSDLDLTRNMSSNERSIRIIGGILLMTIAIAGLGIGSFFGFLFLLLGAIVAGTAIISHCPINKKLEINTYQN